MRILQVVLGALFVIFLSGTVQQLAVAQEWLAPVPQSGPPPRYLNPDGMRIYIWSGPKTHGPGQHDYPIFLSDWHQLLTQHGAIVDGGLHPPNSGDLQQTDVIVIYVGDSGYMNPVLKQTLEAFVKRGGGIVAFHDALCGDDPAYYSTLLGGGKKHGEVNFTLDAPVPYTVTDKAHPIMKDMTDFTLDDEAFFKITWAKDPGIHTLATTVIAPTRSAGEHAGEVVPQMWTYEHSLPGGEPARAFVWMQGHTYANFANYQIQRTLLRGIAWAGKRPVDELVDYVPPPRPERRRPRPPKSSQ